MPKKPRDRAVVAELAIIADVAKRKQLNGDERAAIAAECARYTDLTTGKIVKRGLTEINRLFKVSPATIKRINSDFKRQKAAGVLGPNLRHKKGAGRPSKLTTELKIVYRDVAQEYANLWIRLTTRMLQSELRSQGISLSTSTIHAHLKLMNAREKNMGDSRRHLGTFG